MAKALLLVVCAAIAIATPLVKRQVTSYDLPDGAELVIGPVQSTFNCEGRIYGYYADTSNDCRVFHVCVPSHDGQGRALMYSFFCGNQTVFDQQNLVCSHPEEAVPCDQAQNFYVRNEEFGRTDTPPRF